MSNLTEKETTSSDPPPSIPIRVAHAEDKHPVIDLSM